MATSCRLTAREWSGVILAWGATSGWLSPRAQLPRHADDISAKCDVFLGCMHFFFPSLLEVQSLSTQLFLNPLFIVQLETKQPILLFFYSLFQDLKH